jgi:hypothetical protein
LDIGVVVDVASAGANGRLVARIFYVSTAITGPFSTTTLAGDIELVD